jgi:hypothetical protein
MNPNDALSLMNEIKNIANRPPANRAALEIALNDIAYAISKKKCFSCRIGWRRGGRRQGSALCQKCFEGYL